MNNPQAKPQPAQITCIRKQDRPNPYERITHVGGPAGGGWRLTQEDAIGRIERGEWAVYVLSSNKVVWVEIAKSRFGHKYLRTHGDDDTRNNLLFLPEC